MRKFVAPFLLIIVTFMFFWQFLLKGLLPIPSDTLIGLYHPFRDMYAKDYPNGIPFKNFLITDPIRQQYPWRKLSVEVVERFELPLWNPYSFSGTPFLANFQSASFYPLSILFFMLPFEEAWSFLILLQSILASIFMYLFLKNLRLSSVSSFLGSLVFSFSGFSIAWMEWGTILHVGLWLPLILLSIDKLFYYFSTKEFSIFNFPLRLRSGQEFLIWTIIYVFSLVSSFFAGHLQIFFYVFLFSLVYLLVRWIQFGKNLKILILFLIFHFSFFILTFVQWFPTLQFILESARGVDQNWQIEGWFIPWKHLVQFFAPDFFGNPTTLNYWGNWNYAEFVGYVGIMPLFLAFFGLFFRRDKKTIFFGALFFISLIFALPTFIAKIPYVLDIPFLSSSQPTRLLFVTCFSLSVLAALGFDYLMKQKEKKEILYSLILFFLIFSILWLSILLNIFKIEPQNLVVAKRNLIFPTILLVASFFLILFKLIIKEKTIITILSVIILFFIVFDLFRFGFKFTPFTKKEYLFPNTKAIDFVQKNIGNYRLVSTDPRILPPNFSVLYKVQTVDGYDPLYLLRYGELIAASERGEPNISPPFGFNRIINPKNFNSKIIDLLGVKYVLSLSELNSPKLKKVFQEGKTIVYENKDVLPRAFFVENVINVKSKEEAIKKMFKKDFDTNKIAVIEQKEHLGEIKWWEKKLSRGKVDILEYSENKVVVKTQNEFDGFLVLTDSFYPNWRVKLYNLDDSNFENPSNVANSRVILTDFNFKGVFVPAGNHRIEFFISLFPYFDI